MARHIHINHGPELEQSIDRIKFVFQKNQALRSRYSTRYLAIKFLEGDSEAGRLVESLPQHDELVAVRYEETQRLAHELHESPEEALTHAKYGYVQGALRETYRPRQRAAGSTLTEKIDQVATHRLWGFPLFITTLVLVFYATFELGAYPMGWIEWLAAKLADFASFCLPEGLWRDMVTDGAISGVGAVIVFLPNILILYLFISILEDSGYMARAAFIMDKLMHRIGLHGKSFIPLIMGFGCNVPAVMATRTIESRRSRLITMMILPLMSCSARFPIYIMIIGTMFAQQYRSTVMMSLYIVGIIMAILMSRLFSKTFFKGEDTPFVMELPPYRFPTAKAIGRHTWQKGKEYLKKMGGIILVASITVWALGYFPHNEELSREQQQEQSYIGRIGHAIEPVFRAQGFDWKLDVGLISGVGAKEIVASSMGILYHTEDAAEEGSEESYTNLRRQMIADGITPLTAYCFLLFVLLYFPCIATIAAIKGETGSWKWAGFAAVYTTALAWIVSAAAYQMGVLFGL